MPKAAPQVDFVPLGDGFKGVPLRGAESSLKGRFAGRVGPRVAWLRQLGRPGKTARGGLVDVLASEPAHAEGCSRIVSFDKMAVRGAGMTSLA